MIKVKDALNTSSFVNNMSLPIHRWFRFSAGFSASWAESIIGEIGAGRDITVYDPFAGSGTALLASEIAGKKSIGTESHPFIFKIAKAKLNWRIKPDRLLDYGHKILKTAKGIVKKPDDYPDLILKCFESERLKKLDSLKAALNTENSKLPEYELTWLALVSILRSVSHVGTSQWQYVLPKKSKKRVLDPFLAFENKIEEMGNDMRNVQKAHLPSPKSVLHNCDARSCRIIPSNSVDLVITSPPYANNFDYADAVRLEMSFLGEISGWKDLHDKIRRHLICSCSQHASKLSENWNEITNNAVLEPIEDEINGVCKDLEEEREKHGGKKNYHKMVAYYFLDLGNVFRELRRVCKRHSKICFVVGDSAPYGVHVPVEKWLGELAVSSGFSDYKFEKTRDRNIKWDNRIHNVPLKEGRLWIW